MIKLTKLDPKKKEKRCRATFSDATGMSWNGHFKTKTKKQEIIQLNIFIKSSFHKCL